MIRAVIFDMDGVTDIALEVPDDRIQLRERDSHGFRLTVTNLV